MPGDDTLHWSESFCVGCRQVTWHYDGLCSNRDYHRSTDAFVTVVSDAAMAAAETAQTERRVEHDEAPAEKL